MIHNGTFTEGWLELPAVSVPANQQPTGWRLVWLEPGRTLYGAPAFQARAIPQCVHVQAAQLPVEERRGESRALILAGDSSYKIFHILVLTTAPHLQPISARPCRAAGPPTGSGSGPTTVPASSLARRAKGWILIGWWFRDAITGCLTTAAALYLQQLRQHSISNWIIQEWKDDNIRKRVRDCDRGR